MDNLADIDDFEGKLRQLLLVQTQYLGTFLQKAPKKIPRLEVLSQITGLIDNLQSYNLLVNRKQQKTCEDRKTYLCLARINSVKHEKLKFKILHCNCLIEHLILKTWQVVGLIGLHKIQAIKLQTLILGCLNYNSCNEILSNQSICPVSKPIKISDILEIVCRERSRFLANCIYLVIRSVRFSFGESNMTARDLTSITTAISQEEHNICKLISVMKMTCSGNSEVNSNFFPDDTNISAFYWKHLHKFVCEEVFMLAQCMPNAKESCEDIRRVLDGKLWIAKVFDEVLVMLTVCVASSTWDLSFCEALANVSMKILAVSLPDGTLGTKAGLLLTSSANTIVSCLKEIENSDKNLAAIDVPKMVSELVPCLSSNLEVALSWSKRRIQESLASWNIKNYLIIVHTDLKNLTDVVNSFRKLTVANEADVHIGVKLQSLPGKYMKELMMSTCRRSQSTIGLYMPTGKFWKRNATVVDFPLGCNDYVGEIVMEILEPVVMGVANMDSLVQIGVMSMVMKEFCEAYMDHILNKRIRFSLHGAQMLRTDVGSLLNFVCRHPQLSAEAKQSVQSLEVVRRLKGVLGILLKQRRRATCTAIRSGKVIPINEMQETEQCEDDEDSSDEYFVANVEEWSALRVTSPNSPSSSFWCFCR